MKRIRLRVAYDGTNYHGWQIQKNAITIEEVLTKELERLLGHEIELVGASRTDAGVHALGNVAVFDSETKIPPEKIAIALNRSLPEDIRVQKSEEVPADFHPRYTESRKTYEYTIINTPIQIPTWQRYGYHVYHKLQLEEMKEGAKCFLGTHDFSAFCSVGSQVQTKVRTIYEVSLEEQPILDGNGGRQIKIRISGNGFLYNMVRIIAGTLVEVGIGRKTIEEVQMALETGERKRAGQTAPPQGLQLISIEYEE